MTLREKTKLLQEFGEKLALLCKHHGITVEAREATLSCGGEVIAVGMDVGDYTFETSVYTPPASISINIQIASVGGLDADHNCECTGWHRTEDGTRRCVSCNTEGLNPPPPMPPPWHKGDWHIDGVKQRE